MPSLKSLRFQKIDKYNNPIFICNKDEQDNFNQLKELSEKLEQYDCFTPVYHSDTYNYCTLRIKKNVKHPDFYPNDRFDITFTINKKTNSDTDKISINCYSSKMKLVSKAPVLDIGEELDL